MGMLGWTARRKEVIEQKDPWRGLKCQTERERESDILHGVDGGLV